MSPELWIVVAIVALAGGAVFSTLFQSLRDLSRAALEEISVIRNRPAGSVRAGLILADVNGHATAIALPRIVCTLVVAIALVLWISQLRGNPSPTPADGFLGVGVASILLWIFGVVLPNAIARHAGEATVYAWSPVIRVAYILTRPFQAVSRVVDEAVRRLSGKSDQDEAEALQEEILSVVDEASEEGQFDRVERDMIQAVVKFRDKTVAQVMTPRIDIEAMEFSNDLGEVAKTIRSVGHSRIPVFEGDLDHIVGIFYVKDLMKWLAGDHAGGSRGGKTFDLRAVARPALFVPETKTIRELLTELLKKRVHIAIVADEFGGTAGLVTIEDIVEEVFGDIQDEYESGNDESPEIKVHVGQRIAEADARAYIDDVNADLRPLGIEIPESEDYDTLGGFVTVSLGRIPAKGESFAADGVRVTVLAAEPTRVTRVRIEPSIPNATPEPAPADADEARPESEA